MSKQLPEELPSIDAVDLSTVTGGASRATSRASTDNSQVTAALTSITDSLKAIGTNNASSSGSSLSQMLPMLMMLKGGAGGGCPGGGCCR